MTSTNLSGTSPATLVFTNSTPGNFSLTFRFIGCLQVFNSSLVVLELNSQQGSYMSCKTWNCLCCPGNYVFCLVISPFVPKQRSFNSTLYLLISIRCTTCMCTTDFINHSNLKELKMAKKGVRDKFQC